MHCVGRGQQQKAHPNFHINYDICVDLCTVIDLRGVTVGDHCGMFSVSFSPIEPFCLQFAPEPFFFFFFAFRKQAMRLFTNRKQTHLM